MKKAGVVKTIIPMPGAEKVLVIAGRGEGSGNPNNAESQTALYLTLVVFGVRPILGVPQSSSEIW